MLHKTPIVFIIFNRPELTARVFAAIAAARPSRLFLIADGPRGDFEAQKCKESRSIIEQVDWDCNVFTDFSDFNLGVKKRISSGLDWVFAQVDQAIILEDDCIPNSSFFPFCEELLSKYVHDERIMMISGNNYLPENILGEQSYYFSRSPQIWGWATWRRAWNKYCDRASLWEIVKSQKWLEDIFENPFEYVYWDHRFEKVFSGKVDSWAHIWAFTILMHNGLVIRPKINMVTNIGFGPNSTHTHRNSLIANYPSYEINFPLNHPNIIRQNEKLDRCEFNRIVLKRKNPSGQRPFRSIFLKIFLKLYILRLNIKKRLTDVR